MIHPPVTFLDIDGVLATGRSLRINRGRVRPFDREAIAALNLIIERTGALIVVSSDWRTIPLSELIELLELEGLPRAAIIGSTPVIVGALRSREIAAYLDANPQVTRWVAIDDRESAGPKNLCWTDYEQGLTHDLALEIIDGFERARRLEEHARSTTNLRSENEAQNGDAKQ